MAKTENNKAPWMSDHHIILKMTLRSWVRENIEKVLEKVMEFYKLERVQTLFSPAVNSMVSIILI